MHKEVLILALVICVGCHSKPVCVSTPLLPTTPPALLPVPEIYKFAPPVRLPEPTRLPPVRLPPVVEPEPEKEFKPDIKRWALYVALGIWAASSVKAFIKGQAKDTIINTLT